MSRPPWQEELQQLCEAVVEDRLTTEQRDRIEALVAQHPEAKRFYVEYLHQHACLAWSAAQPDFLNPSPQPVATTRPPGFASAASRRRLVLTILTLAASVALVFAGAKLFGPRSSQLATLVSAEGCQWNGGTLPTEEGARLGPGRLRLAEGITRIVFDNGAELTLEAPADFELISAQRCVLHAGRLVARVPPPAIGFVVDTPTAVFRDLGTEFGVNVRDAQTADLQVFTGEVDAKHRPTGQVQRLQTGQSRRFAADQVISFEPQVELPSPAAPPPPPSPAETRVLQISTAMGRGKDTYVQPLFPSPNSSDVLLLIKNSSQPTNDYNRKAYIGLDLAPVAGTTIVDAQLSFTFTPTGMGFGSALPDATFAVYGLTDKTLDNWDERTVRWKTAPANALGGAGVDPGKVLLLGKFTIPKGAVEGTRSIAGKDLVDFLNHDLTGLATFILVRETIGNGKGADLVHGFASKRHPTLPPPTLKLTVKPANPPG